MKKIVWMLIAVAAICGLTWGFLELREGGYMSSYAAQPESPAPPQAVGSSLTYNFDSDAVGGMPAKFHSARTGQGAESKWEVIADPSAPSKPNVAAQTSTDKTDYRFPLLISDEGSFKDLELSVKFKAVSGEVDRAGGLVFRLKDANNYYIVRANALESNVVLYKVENGVRLSIAPKGLPSRSYGVSHEIPRGHWNILRVDFQGTVFTVSLNGERLFEVEDRTFTKPGKTGLWTKADSVTYFDEFTVMGK